MKKLFYQSFKMLVIMTIFLGLIYPFTVLAIAKGLSPWRSNGSMVYRDGAAVGSELLGQGFSGPGYFHGRPSSAGGDGYDAAASSGSNLGPTNQLLLQGVSERAARVRSENRLADDALVPSDLVTASASGLDPHISPDAALIQVERVARERNLPPDMVKSLVYQYTEYKPLGLIGEPRVNILRLNLELDNLDKR